MKKPAEAAQARPPCAGYRDEALRHMPHNVSAGSHWRRLGCWVTGHDYSIASDQARMFVRCNRCGHTSQGLEIDRDLFRRGRRDERAGDAGNRRRAGHSGFATP